MFVFPLAIALSLFSTTAFLIVLAVLGQAELAAEVGVVQGASLGVFLAFSANGRNLILSAMSATRFLELVRVRLLLLPVLCLGVWLLSAWVVSVEQWLIWSLVLRRSLEWLGELALSEAERSRNFKPARRFTVGQIAAFGLLVVAAFAEEPLLRPALLLWSLSPLFGAGGWIRPAVLPGTWSRKAESTVRAGQLAAHFTSTWAIGLSTYLFRLFLVLLTGKALAGSLIAGFAVGGTLNSLYTYAVGPSLASGSLVVKGLSGRLVGAVILGLLAIGLITAALPGFPLSVRPTDGTNWPVFVQTIGFSIVGGIVMIWAQSIRLKLLHATRGDDVMVPDVLANVLIVAGVPFILYLLGHSALPLLFLWNSALTAAIYWFVLADEAPKPSSLWTRIGRDRLQAWSVLILGLPLFFQLSGEVFRSKDMFFDSQASLLKVPLPLSSVFCFLSLVVLLRVDSVRLAVAFLFAFFLGMLPNVLLVTPPDSLQQLSKMILVMQFILPVFALVLGQSYLMPARLAHRYDAVLFFVAIAVMAVEVLASWAQGSIILVPYLFFLSIYQHQQYVPVLMLVLFGLGLPTLLHNDRWRAWVIAFAPVCAVYAVSSTLQLALALAIACLGAGAWLLWSRKQRVPALLWAVLFAVPMFGYVQVIKSTQNLEEVGSTRTLFAESGGSEQSPGTATTHLEQRPLVNARESIDYRELLGYWRSYWTGITESPRSLLLGHLERPDRETTPSAHNYYLDLVYNFGVVALLPWLFLLFRSAKLAWTALRSRSVTIDLIWLLGAVAFFTLVDNSLKVGFRQPYPGILMFFLWGVLLTRLSAKVAEPRA